MAIMMGVELHAAWGELLQSVRTGEAGFQKRFGKHFSSIWRSTLTVTLCYPVKLSLDRRAFFRS
jgi:hypothetical protein